MFKKVLDYYESLNLMHPHLRYSLERRIEYLKSQQEETIRKMRMVVGKYHYENIPKLFKNIENFYRIEFFKGVDDFTMCLSISDLSDFDEEIGLVFKDEGYDLFIGEITDEIIAEWERKAELAKAKIEPIPYDENIYPTKDKKYFTDLYHQFSHRLTYTWLGWCWQKAGGNSIGLIVGTVENNSVRRFSFNDFSFGELSDKHDADSYKEFIEPSFKRKLSFEEIYIRASVGIYPQTSFSNIWFYHEKGDDFFEIGCYGDKTGIRQGKISELETVAIMDLNTHFGKEIFNTGIFEAKKLLFKISNEKINNGWVLKFRPLNAPKKLYREAIRLPSVNQSFHQILKETTPFLAIKNLEEMARREFPIDYKIFLHFNGEESKNNFNIVWGYSEDSEIQIKLTKIYSSYDLFNFLKHKDDSWDNYLLFGFVENYGGIYISLNEENYNKIYIKPDYEYFLVNDSFECFINGIIAHRGFI